MNTGRIYKSKYEGRYTTIPNDLLRSKNLTLGAKGMMCMLLSLPNDWVVYQSNLRTMCAGETKYSISKIFRELETNGYIEKRKVKNEQGKFVGWDYIVYSEPLDGATEQMQPTTENGTSGDEKPKSEIPTSVKQPLLNTDTIEQIKKSVAGAEKFAAFQEWLKTNAPNVQKLKQPFTQEDYEKIFNKFNRESVLQVLQDMDNYKPLLTKYVSAYKTAANWLYKRRATKGTETPQISGTPGNKGNRRTFKNPPVYKGENAKYAHWFDKLDEMGRHPLWEIADEFGTINYDNKTKLERAIEVVTWATYQDLIPQEFLIKNQLFARFTGGYVQPLGVQQQHDYNNGTLKPNQIFKGLIY